MRQHRRLATLAAVTLLGACAPPAGNGPAPGGGLDEVIETELRNSMTPGAVVAIVTRDSTRSGATCRACRRTSATR